MDTLTGTVYCDGCQSYFRVTADGLSPIFIENREIYRKYTKIEEKHVLCALCEERNEIDQNKERAEGEQLLKLNKVPKNALKRHNLCRECVEKVNSKLTEDKEKYYGPYRVFIIRKKLTGLFIVLVSICIYRFFSSFIGALLLSCFIVHETRSVKWTTVSILFCFLTHFLSDYFVFLFSGLVASWILVRRRCKEVKYLHFMLDVEKMEKEILRKVKSLTIGKTKNRPSEEEPVRSFVHNTYSQRIRKTEEVETIAKGISDLKIKDTWYAKVDKLVEWLATT